MSKKKATMTLKDFHGGSIPSDLPLPSAPGATARPSDRGGFDRQMSWGNSGGRSEHRLRPASAGSARNLDDKTPFLSHSQHIGRNFDEDERKPLDGVSAPRRTVGDDNFRAQSPRVVESKVENLSGARFGSRRAPAPASQMSSGSYAGRLSEVNAAGMNNQNLSGSRSYGPNHPNLGGNAGHLTAPYTNAWGVRRETASVKEPVSAAWSAPDAETKLAHASALEKVSSGRWNSKQHVHPQREAPEVFQHVENQGELQNKATYNKNNYNRLDVAGDTDYHDTALTMHAERSLTVDDGARGGGRNLEAYERVKHTRYMESNHKHSIVSPNGSQPIRPKSVGADYESALPSDLSERPKLKLLPRTKPLENLEPAVDYEKQAGGVRLEDSSGLNEPSNPLQSGSAGPAVGDQAQERPKLNLKPRSQPLEQLEGKSEVKRISVLGQTRAGEVVLKGRVYEDEASTYASQPPVRFNEDTRKVGSAMLVGATVYIEKTEHNPGDQKLAKYTHRRDHRVDAERSELQRRNWRNESWKNNREVEKQQRNQQQEVQQERPPSPETWRKPIDEHTKPDDGPPVRHGKATSAVELAQAFSKSVSDPTLVSRPRGLPGRSQVPFSRLMGPSPRPQINGY